MRVEVRLYATLADRIPQASAAAPFEVDLADGSTVADLVEQLDLPKADVHLAVIDGRIVHDRAAPLSAGQRVALFPPVGGG
jgi:molybdopterin converting factor small subunit